MKTRNTTMNLIALIAVVIATPQTSYTQGTRSKDVNVVNTPNVNVVNTPTVNLEADSVVGINPSSNTVHVASSSREPVLTMQTLSVEFLFQKQLEIDLAEGQFEGSTEFTVPAGLLLVIDNVGGFASVGITGDFFEADFITTANNLVAAHFLASFPGGPLQYSVFTFGPIYADPGSTVVVVYKRVGGNASGVAKLNVTFSGHYISQ
jgi:hypothetical protein